MAKHNFSVVKSGVEPEFKDELIAKKYISKAANAEKSGIEFKLPLLSWVNINKAKRCYYTGVKLNDTTRSIDRVDNSKGYIKGNVVACHRQFNGVKGWFENPTSELTKEEITKGFLKWMKEDK